MSELTTAAEFVSAVVDLSGTSTTVFAYPAILRGAWVNTDTAGGVTLITDNGVTVNSIPSGTVAGQWLEFGDNFFKSDITVDSTGASSGSLTIVYKPVHSN